MFHVQYHGYVGIAAWEYFVSALYLVILFIFFSRTKNKMLKNNPEYSYYLWGLYAKVAGGVFFGLMYFYYYKGGDTVAYFYSAVSMSKLAKLDFISYLTVLFGDNSWENRNLFNPNIGYPFMYVYFDHRTFFVIRLISPLVILAMDSYMITTVVLASISYIPIWKFYRTLVGYFPDLKKELAIAVLFMPSCIFWGSAILKDTFTLSAVALWIQSIDEIIYKRKFGLGKFIAFSISSIVIIMVKPYILMVLFPVTLLWVLYFKVVRIKSSIFKLMVLPFVMVVFVYASFGLLEKLESSLGKFSLQRAIDTIEINQKDMKRIEQYGSNYFDIGEFDGTWTGLISKFPVATTAGLFRPFIWEARNVVMVLSGIENAWLLWLLLSTLRKSGVGQFLKITASVPLILMALLFSVLFAFLVGATTPNFGALVRFKIPLIPLLVSALFMIRRIVDIRSKHRVGLRYLPAALFAQGTAGLDPSLFEPAHSRTGGVNQNGSRRKFSKTGYAKT